MATVSFSYRSKKDTAFLEARLSYRVQGNPNPLSFYTRSKIEVSKEFWKDYAKGVKFKDVTKNNLKKKIETDTHDIRTYVINEFEKTDLSQIDKEWFKTTIKHYYNPPQTETENKAPEGLVSYIDFYIKQKRDGLSKAQLTKWGVIKNKMQRFEHSTGQQILFKNINEDFLREFSEYYKAEKYSK
ncbi:MAG: phage integrase SAM-like domain-containing protein, partial [Flavobacteriaceae bacterium]